jgi:large subunit ribosomal protein L13
MKKEIIIDAKGQKLGRVASRVAFALRGKTDPDFLPHRVAFPKVYVKNIDELDLSTKKLKETFFIRFSGYPSGDKHVRAYDIAQRDKRELFRRAVLGMLHRNRLRDQMIKNLILYHGDKA